jgi:flagellar protein FlgJ
MGAEISGLGSGVASLSPTNLENRKADDPAKVKDAAQQFEALLMGQILRSERESNGGGWLGSGSGAGDSATDYAEQQLAAALAAGGGLGLADLIASGLKKTG